MGSFLKRVFSKKVIIRLTIAAVVLAIIGAAALVREWLESPEVAVGTQAEDRLQAYKWHEGAHTIQLIEDPDHAFLIRRRLIREATDSIDLSTFIWRDDDSGLALMQELIDAAARGVRVRLLGDGVFFLRKPEKVAAMAQAQQNLVLKFYNPIDNELASLGPTVFEDLLFDFSDINQRLHMKILTIDGKRSLVGGRNIGNEYFGQDSKLNFIDRDILIEGPAVEDIIAAFELFWNDSRTTAAGDLDDVAASEPDTAWLQQSPQLALPEDTAIDLDSFSVRDVSVWYDRPGLIGDEEEYVPRLVSDRMAALVGAAEESVTIETPYLVLSDKTQALFKKMHTQKPNVTLRFITNSLASTDNWETYAAFHQQLQTMLNYRFLIHLKKPQSLVQQGGASGAKTALHAKTCIVDGESAAVGSFNWDPRSGTWNAEIMVIMQDKAFAATLNDSLATVWSPDASWIVAERDQPIGLEQIDAIGSTIHGTISDVLGVNLWPLTNTSCFDFKGDTQLSPYDPDFHEHYKPVGSFPEVPISDKKQILTRLLHPVSGPFVPAL